MEFKDIVNRDLVTLTNCDHEPIHIPGSIQPHGFLLGLKKDDFSIAFCSGNCADYTGFRHEQLLGKPFATVFEKQADALRHYVTAPDSSFAAPLLLRLAGRDFSCVVQKNNPDVYVTEFEPAATGSLASLDVYCQTAQFTTYMQKAESLQSLCQLVADETRAITGYDRVMVYRFDNDYNGEVFAESKVDRVEPFFGLHYPHTDIPAQARELYVKNLLRLIVDVSYAPVPIYTLQDSATNAALDLSFSTLRSVSPIHVQYLQNMGVGATLNLSLLHEGKLWGLIACHHYSPKYLSYDARIAAQLQAHFLTSQISVREQAEEYKMAKGVNTKLETLVAGSFSAATIPLENIVQQKGLLSFVTATGVALLVEGIFYTHGDVPPAGDLKILAGWLVTNHPLSAFSTERLCAVYPPAQAWCEAASGVVYHPLGAGNCLIFFRREVVREVAWAGNPEKAIEKNEHGLSPRKSFALWKETKRGESLPWRKPELAATSIFANALQRHVYMMHLSREELRQRKLSQKLQEVNAELENMNWIGSHDLKEPLRKIHLFASRILDEEKLSSDKTVREYVSRMQESAKRMQNLITDMLAYSRLNHVDEGAGEVNLNEVVSAVLHELQYEITEKGAQIECDDLPTVRGVAFLIRQLLVNLIGNALKFSKPDVPPQITISASTGMPPLQAADGNQRYHRIAIADNGIGFDNKHKDQVFQVFKKLHTTPQYNTGTGVGLALSRKIMQNHEGFIDAESEPGKGTTFYLYFPG